ncbi:MAG: hypothetical protein P4L99_01375 [Chthoniobacter sp.]|nr:hypothetical protein [Chthoniobacter sp.]
MKTPKTQRIVKLRRNEPRVFHFPSMMLEVEFSNDADYDLEPSRIRALSHFLNALEKRGAIYKVDGVPAFLKADEGTQSKIEAAIDSSIPKNAEKSTDEAESVVTWAFPGVETTTIRLLPD